MTRFVALTCWKCKEVYGLSEETHALVKRTHMSFHCPWGHSAAYKEGPSEAETLRKQLETQKQQNARAWERADEERKRAEAAERSAAAFKGVTTRLKNRAAAGVCPCCNRTFVNLQRHMAGKHPGFAAPEGGEGATIQ